MKIIILIILALATIGCVTINNYPNQTAPTYVLPDMEPRGEGHVKWEI